MFIKRVINKHMPVQDKVVTGEKCYNKMQENAGGKYISNYCKTVLKYLI